MFKLLNTMYFILTITGNYSILCQHVPLFNLAYFWESVRLVCSPWREIVAMPHRMEFRVRRRSWLSTWFRMMTFAFYSTKWQSTKQLRSRCTWYQMQYCMHTLRLCKIRGVAKILIKFRYGQIVLSKHNWRQLQRPLYKKLARKGDKNVYFLK